jgi:hypothetical protein
MTTPTGVIKASDIANEFGYSRANNSVSLGNYRISQTVSGLSNLPLDIGVPQGTAAIGFGNLRGKKLNIVVDCTPAPGTVAVRVNAKSRYDSNTSITYIGNFVSKPSSTADKKVWIHTNGTIAPDGQTGKIIYFSTSRDAAENNYIYLSADGYPTLTFGPNAGGYYYAVYNGVQYSVSGNSGLKLSLNGSTQVRGDDYGSRGDGDYNDLVLNAGEGSFYQSGGSIFYKFGSTLINRTRCSFLTGSWDPKTDLHIDIGPSGGVYGSGGNGGYNSAFDGTSAIGIIATNKVVITNRGSVLPGGGGGGLGGVGANGSYRVLTYGNGYRYGTWGTITTYGGGGGAGGIGQGYGYSNAAGAGGAAGGSGAGAGGQGGTGGTWGKPGGDGARGGPNSQGTAGLGGGEGGYDYVISNNGTGVSGLSPNVALNTTPT